MHASDAAIVAELSAELGYPASAALITERIALLSDQTTHRLLVAELAPDSLIGWVYVYGVKSFQADRYAEIGGLVVGTRARRTGAGSGLMQAAEAWAHEQGYASMRLRSGMHRPEAHLFYAAIGYGKVRESMLFQKGLATQFTHAAGSTTTRIHPPLQT